MGRGDFVNANDINWHIPISWVNENRNTFTRHYKNLVHNYRPSANPKSKFRKYYNYVAIY